MALGLELTQHMRIGMPQTRGESPAHSPVIWPSAGECRETTDGGDRRHVSVRHDCFGGSDAAKCSKIYCQGSGDRLQGDFVLQVRARARLAGLFPASATSDNSWTEMFLYLFRTLVQSAQPGP